MATIAVKRWLSPVGALVLGSVGERLCMCDWDIEPRRASVDRRVCRAFGAQMECVGSSAIERAIAELTEYFTGERREFDLPLALAGTEFQRRVWTALAEVPYGSVMSYGELARRIGAPTSVRAVASAVGANPISIIVPCHRIVGADGSLTGYAGGLPAKRALLGVEGRGTPCGPL